MSSALLRMVALVGLRFLSATALATTLRSKGLGGSRAVEDTPCSAWNCNCQDMTNKYGTDHAVTWGTAPEVAREWWTANNCHTKPPCNKPDSWWNCTCQGMSHLYGTSASTWGSAPQEAQDWWTIRECKTGPLCKPWLCSCQGVTDRFGTDHALTWGSAPQIAQDWWVIRKCTTKPLCFPWSCSCQVMSNTYETAHGISWGSAPAEARHWWTAKQCTTVPQTPSPTPSPTPIPTIAVPTKEQVVLNYVGCMTSRAAKYGLPVPKGSSDRSLVQASSNTSMVKKEQARIGFVLAAKAFVLVVGLLVETGVVPSARNNYGKPYDDEKKTRYTPATPSCSHPDPSCCPNPFFFMTGFSIFRPECILGPMLRPLDKAELEVQTITNAMQEEMQEGVNNMPATGMESKLDDLGKYIKESDAAVATAWEKEAAIQRCSFFNRGPDCNRNLAFFQAGNQPAPIIDLHGSAGDLEESKFNVWLREEVKHVRIRAQYFDDVHICTYIANGLTPGAPGQNQIAAPISCMRDGTDEAKKETDFNSEPSDGQNMGLDSLRWKIFKHYGTAKCMLDQVSPGCAVVDSDCQAESEE